MAETDRNRWDQRYSQVEEVSLAPPLWIEEFDTQIPRSKGPALDIAAGAGGLSVWMARRGLKVIAMDISAVGLQLASRSALTWGLSIETMVAD